MAVVSAGRRQLLAEYAGARQAMQVWLRYWYDVARRHRPDADAAGLWRLVVGWASPPSPPVGYLTNRPAKFASTAAGRR